MLMIFLNLGWENELTSAVERGGRLVLFLPTISRDSQKGSLTDPSLNGKGRSIDVCMFNN